MYQIKLLVFCGSKIIGARQTDKQAGRQADRLTGKQIDRHIWCSRNM